MKILRFECKEIHSFDENGRQVEMRDAHLLEVTKKGTFIFEIRRKQLSKATFEWLRQRFGEIVVLEEREEE